MRFIDRLLGQELGDRRLEPVLRRCQKIVADNVARFFFEVSDKENWDRIDDFPNVAPPFREFWIEARAPKMINSEIYGLRSWEEAGRGDIQGWGVLFLCDDLEGRLPAEPDMEALRSRVTAYNRTLEPYEKGTRPLPTEPDQLKALRQTAGTRRLLGKILEDLGRGDRSSFDAVASIRDMEVRWCMETYVFIDLGKITFWKHLPLMSFQWFIKPDGRFASFPSDPHTAMCEQVLPDYTAKSMDNQPPTALGEELIAFVNATLLAICFMHCKNVQLCAVNPNPKESKLWQARHEMPLQKYTVLEIDHLKQSLRTEGRMDETGLKRAMHICRGNFAHYTEDHPLFGKYIGDFWRPQHMRGNESLGRIDKIYEVK